MLFDATGIRQIAVGKANFELCNNAITTPVGMERFA